MSTVNGTDSTPQIDVLEGTEATVNGYVVRDQTSAIVIDCFRNSADATRMADHLDALGLAPSHVLITHGHPDHYLGLGVMRARFPQTRLVVAREEIKRGIAEFSTWMEQQGWLEGEPGMKPWSTSNPDGFDYERHLEVLEEKSLRLAGGTELRLETDYAPAEADYLTTISVPEADAFFSSDFAYNQVHHWAGVGVTREHIENWIAQLGHFAKERAEARIFPGHGPSPTDAGVFAASTAYLRDFLEVTSTAASKEEAVTEMRRRYPNYAEQDFLLPMSVDFHVTESADT